MSSILPDLLQAFDVASLAMARGRVHQARRSLAMALALRPDWQEARALADRLSQPAQAACAP